MTQSPNANPSAQERISSDHSANSQTAGPLPEPGDELVLGLEEMVAGGKALAHTPGGQVVFVDMGVPGQKIRARVSKAKGDYLEAERLAVITPAPEQAEPFCPHFEVCGGCVWQEIPYSRQLEYKRAHILDSFKRLAGTDGKKAMEDMVAEVLPSPLTRHFRGKVEFVFGTAEAQNKGKAKTSLRKGATPLLGFRRMRSHEVVDIATCPIADERLPGLLEFVRNWAGQSQLRVYTGEALPGQNDLSAILRFLVVRTSHFDNNAAVELITAPGPQAAKRIRELGQYILAQFPWVVSFTHSIRKAASNIAQGEEIVLNLGQPKLREELAGFYYDLSPASFFQTNPAAAEVMVREAMRLLTPAAGETIWDLYCGVGTFSLPLAAAGAEVLGLEVNAAAVADARANCTVNKLSKCSFAAGDVKELMRKQAGRGRPTAILTDPPRAGLHPDVAAALLKIRPERILLVSCHLATLVRDVAVLSKAYSIGAVQGLDLFPHSAHVETLCLLEAR